MAGADRAVAKAAAAGTGPAVGESRGWPLHRYLVGLVVLFVVAAGFGARLAAQEVGGDVASIRASVTALAANPSIGQAFTAPAGCSLQLELPGGTDAGHLDLIRPDGTVACSSRPASGGVGGRLDSYAGASWWLAAMRGPMLIAPAADQRTGSAALLCSIPVAGSGLVAGFVNLAVLGGVLGDLYGGPRHLTFLVTTADGGTVLTRSADPGRWVGAGLAGTPFGTGGGVGERC